jgi:hypothetical protein
MVHLTVNQTTTIVAEMVVSLGKGEVTIQYLNGDNMVIASDNLSAYKFFQLDQRNHRQCLFRSPLVDRTVVFQRDCDSADFLSLMTRHGHFAAVPNNPYSFEISIQAHRPTDLFGYMNRLYHQFSGDQTSPPCRPVDGIVLGTIEPSLPPLQCAALTFDDAESLSLSPAFFSTLLIPIDVYPVIYSRLLCGAASIADYLRIREQWQLTSHAEWGHNYGLRVFVHDTERWLDQAAVIVHKQVFFNVCMSLFTFQFGELSLKNHLQLMFLIKVVFLVFLTPKCTHERIVARGGETLADKDAESLVFWKAKAVIDLAAAANFSMLKESLAIRSLLSNISASTLDMLNDRSITSFDFAFREAVLVFADGRSYEEEILLASAAIASGDFRMFYENGIAASLVLLQEKLQTVPLDRVDEFYRLYAAELRRLDPRLLLHNIERMLASTRH